MTTNNISIALPIPFIEAALLCASTEQSRYYLNGVFIDGRGYIASTDGHRMFYAVCDDAKQLESVSIGTASMPGVIIPTDTLKSVLKLAKGHSTLLLTKISDAGGWSLGVEGGATLPFKPIDGTFPDWQRVIPSQSDEPMTAGHYNPKYVADVGKVSAILSTGVGNRSKGCDTKYLIHQDGTKPAPITFYNPDYKPGQTLWRDDCAMVLMPIRPADHVWTRPGL